MRPKLRRAPLPTFDTPPDDLPIDPTNSVPPPASALEALELLAGNRTVSAEDDAIATAEAADADGVAVKTPGAWTTDWKIGTFPIALGGGVSNCERLMGPETKFTSIRSKMIVGGLSVT